MNEDRNRTNSAEEWERVKRVRAISELAQQRNTAAQEPSGISHSPPPRTMDASAYARWRRWYVLLGVVAAIAVTAASLGVYFLQLAPSPLPPIQEKLTLDLRVSGLDCPRAIAWAPDGLRLAVLASIGYCDPARQPATAIAIFDARQGRLLRRADLSQELATRNLTGYFGKPVWSPDSATLGFPLSIVAQPTNQLSPGLLLIPARGGDTHIFTSPSSAVDEPLLWNVTTGHAEPWPDSFPPALTYKWTANGQLAPDQPLPQAASSAGFSGVPSSSADGKTISRWQSGALSPIYPLGPNGIPDAGRTPVGWYTVAFPSLWSPDGQYLATDLPLRTRLPLAGEAVTLDSTFCNSQGAGDVCAQSPAALPDHALESALHLAQTGYRPQNTTSDITMRWMRLSIDWRPDGKVMAAILPGDGFIEGTSAIRVTLLSAASGQVLARLTTKAVTGGDVLDGGQPYTSWSPSGEQLALFDYGGGSVTIWGATRLPR